MNLSIFQNIWLETKAHLADNEGIFKSFEIEYIIKKKKKKKKKKKALCKPAIHLNPLLINFWVLFVLSLFEPSKGAK